MAISMCNSKRIAKNYSLPVIAREQIREQLDDSINTFVPVIIKGIDFQQIDLWKAQFVFENCVSSMAMRGMGVILRIRSNFQILLAAYNIN